ncbi:MAG: phosphocholine cytidylyltransferase family protein, partial [Pseudomonadota bacterium]
MKAIILAAGRGARLGDITESIPKCLVTIGSKTILDYQLKGLSSAGIHTVAIVLGYKSELIKEHLSSYAHFNFSFIDNPDYGTTNTAYSLWLARHEMTDSFLYLNGDVLGHEEIIKRLSRAPARDSLAVVRKMTGEEEVKVILDGARIRSIGKKISSVEAYGEFIGIAKFSISLAPVFISELEKVLNAAGGRNEYFEAALENLTTKAPLAALDVTDLPCIEIDFPEDLQQARMHILPELSAAHGSRKPKILFYAERNLHLPFLEPIHDYLAEHCQAELAFSSPPYAISQGPIIGHGLNQLEVDRLKGKSIFYERPADFQADVAV